jgi:hypothetical protein
MAFHLPFFALRKAPLPSMSDPKVRGKRLRSWKKLSLLRDSSGHKGQEAYRLYPAQISFVCYGSDEYQYTVCEFVDTEHDSNEGSELYDWHGDENDDAQELDQDPILSRPSGTLPARRPIWRPRQYFAKALEASVEEVSQEWDQVVCMLETDKVAYVCLQL